jgi:hypothetical protein
LDFGHPQELFFDKKNNVRYCQADAELNTGSSKLSYRLYYGPSGSELVEVKDGEDAYGAREMAAEAAAAVQPQQSASNQAQVQSPPSQPQQPAQAEQPTDTQTAQASAPLPAANQAPPTAKFTDDLPFPNYPVEIYTGPIAQPDFSGKASNYAQYKTRISDALRGGVNFSGTMAIAVFGCGTGCIMGYATDLRSGNVYDLPVGGEDYTQLILTYKPNSSLIQAQWTGADSDHPTCVHAFFQWTGAKFNPLQKREIAGECPDAP